MSNTHRDPDEYEPTHATTLPGFSHEEITARLARGQGAYALEAGTTYTRAANTVFQRDACEPRTRVCRLCEAFILVDAPTPDLCWSCTPDEDEITQVRPLVDMLAGNATAPRVCKECEAGTEFLVEGLCWSCHHHGPTGRVVDYSRRKTNTKALVYALTHWAPLEYTDTERARATLRDSAFILMDVTDTEHSEWTYTHEGRELHVSQIGATLVLR